VAVGVCCALLEERLAPCVHFVGDLAETGYRDLLFANMRFEEFVTALRGRGWRVRRHTSWLRAGRARLI